MKRLSSFFLSIRCIDSNSLSTMTLFPSVFCRAGKFFLFSRSCFSYSPKVICCKTIKSSTRKYQNFSAHNATLISTFCSAPNVLTFCLSTAALFLSSASFLVSGASFPCPGSAPLDTSVVTVIFLLQKVQVEW